MGYICPEREKYCQNSIIKLFVWGFCRNWFDGVRIDFIVQKKLFFCALDHFFAKIPTSIFEIMGYICPKCEKCCQKSTIKFFVCFFRRNWFEGVESDFIVHEKQYFGALDPFCKNSYINIWNNGIYMPRTWKNCQKSIKKFLYGGFHVESNSRESKVTLWSGKNNILVP